MLLLTHLPIYFSIKVNEEHDATESRKNAHLITLEESQFFTVDINS